VVCTWSFSVQRYGDDCALAVVLLCVHGHASLPLNGSASSVRGVQTLGWHFATRLR
jgi:hypothetical protein